MRNGIFIDLDETLLTNDQRISAFDKKVIQTIVAQGHKVYLITGKALQSAVTWYEELQLDTLLITSLGQVISNPSDPSFKPQIITSDFALLWSAVEALQKRVELHNFLFHTYDGQLYAKHLAPSNLTNLLVHNAELQQWDQTQHLNLVVGAHVETSMLDQDAIGVIVSELNTLFDEQLEMAYWLTDGELPIISIKPAHIGKSIAMLQVQAIDHLDYLICFGNGWSDRNMLALANESYAMTNAVDVVKSYAKYQADDSNNNSGVGKTLARIFKLDVAL